MKLYLKFLEIFEADDIFGARIFEFNFKGNTVEDLIFELIEKYGLKAKVLFFNKDEYRSNLQIIINWRKYVSPNLMDKFILNEGDTIIFAPLTDGG